MDCSLPGSSVHGIFQARVLEWGAISFSRASSQPRDRTRGEAPPPSPEGGAGPADQDALPAHPGGEAALPNYPGPDHGPHLGQRGQVVGVEDDISSNTEGKWIRTLVLRIH